MPWDWENSVEVVSKFYGLKWEEVQRWNIITFMHRADFIKHKTQKENLFKKR